MRRRLHLRITGYVQGVSFRYSARRQAQALDLAGWVRNCPDDSVEIEIEGDGEHVDQFLGWARRGPSGAEVEGVQVDELDPSGEVSGFRIVG